MSFDVFVGRPTTRILWSEDLLRYLDAETDWDAHGVQPREAILPEISRFAFEISKGWPPLNACGPLEKGALEDDADNPRLVDYCFGPSSVYLCCSWSMADEAHAEVSAMAARHNLLFVNCSGRDWMNAARTCETSRSVEISVGESETPGFSRAYVGTVQGLEPGDADLLTAPDRFKPYAYFTCVLADDHYMQARNTGKGYLIEYRDGSPERHYQAQNVSLEEIREALRLYLADDAQAFRLLDWRKTRV
jgi:hypothetical protein